MYQTGVCAMEVAGVEVERRQLRFEVNVKPLTTGGFGVEDRQPDELATDSSVLMTGACLRVDQECVISSVPGDIDEADKEPVRVAGTNPAQAVRADPVPPADTRVPAVRHDEVDHLVVGYGPAPGEGDRVRHVRKSH